MEARIDTAQVIHLQLLDWLNRGRGDQMALMGDLSQNLYCVEQEGGRCTQQVAGLSYDDSSVRQFKGSSRCAFFFSQLIGQTSGRNALILVDNPFPVGKRSLPRIIPLLRPLSYGRHGNPQDSWIFLAVSPDMFRAALQTLPKDSIAYAVTSQGEIAASLN